MLLWIGGAVYFVLFHHRLFLKMRASDVPLVESAIMRRGLTMVSSHAPGFFERWKQPPSSGWARLVIAEARMEDGTPVEVRLTIDPAYDKSSADIRVIKVLK